MPHSLLPFGGGSSIGLLPAPSALPSLLAGRAFVRVLPLGLLYVLMPYGLRS